MKTERTNKLSVAKSSVAKSGLITLEDQMKMICRNVIT